MKQIIITDKEAGQRLDKYLHKYFNNAPKSFVYKMLRKKRIKRNGAKSDGSDILQKDDKIQMYIAEETALSLHESNKLDNAVEITFKTLYEDRNILVVNKPAGCLSQKDRADCKNSLIDQVIFYLWEKGEYDPEKDGAFTPALCNRLDRNTSGIVIIGKSMAALQEIDSRLRQGDITKRYLTLTRGQAKHSDKLKGYITKDSGKNTVSVTAEQSSPRSKPITTAYERIGYGDKYSYLEVTLKMGRPHQIRAHLASVGLPVIGDKKYGHKGTNMSFLRKYKLNRQFLHSSKIAFYNFEGDFSYLNGKEVYCSLPGDLAEIVDDIFGHEGE